MDWMQALEAFCSDNIQLKHKTIINYKAGIRSFFEFCPKQIDQIKSTDVIAWFSYLKTRYTRNTVSGMIMSLRFFFNYLIEEDVVSVNPAAKIRIRFPDDMQANSPINKDEYKQLIDASKHNMQHQVMMAILYTGGLRRNELVKLKINDIDWNRGVLRVNDYKELKQREVIVTYDCLTRLRAYLQSRKNDSELIFPSSHKGGKPLTGQAINCQINIYKNKLGFKQLSPRLFRYTYASNLWVAGFSLGEIAQLMGHESINVTQRYITCFEGHLKQIHTKYCI